MQNAHNSGSNWQDLEKQITYDKLKKQKIHG